MAQLAQLIGKRVRIERKDGKLFEGILAVSGDGYTVRSGKRGRPAVFAEADVDTLEVLG